MIDIEIRSSLKKVREEKGMTVRKLEEISGISKSQINNIENNNTIPTIWVLEKIAHALNVDIKELYIVITN